MTDILVHMRGVSLTMLMLIRLRELSPCLNNMGALNQLN